LMAPSTTFTEQDLQLLIETLKAIK
jgi:hypothetical protein